MDLQNFKGIKRGKKHFKNRHKTMRVHGRFLRDNPELIGVSQDVLEVIQKGNKK